MRRARPVVAVVLAALAAAIGCGDAPDSAQGGEALLTVEAGADAPVCPPKSQTWADLYACYFGPTARSSCTAAGICHGDSTMLGARSSGYVCGHTQQDCFKGMTAMGSIVPAGGADDPKTTGLYVAIRKFDGSGTMPKNSSFVFTQEDVAIISAWITNGASGP
jgi:hypothetical protein